MNELTNLLLDKIGIGIIVIDRHQEILVWNDWLVRYTQNRKEDVLGQEISKVIPRFAEKMYNDMLTAALFQGQGRFCSGSLHPSFIETTKVDGGRIKQNLIIDPVTMGNDVFAVLQLIDVTAYHTRVSNLKTKMKSLEIIQDELIEAQKANRELALHDSLTGLPNRTLLMERLAWGSENALRNRDMMGIMFIDLDGFKIVNDTLGHDWGDITLQSVAARLKNCIRKNDAVARYGGDEFVVVLMQLKNIHNAELIAGKILEAFQSSIQINNFSFKITVSIGISLFPNDGTDLDVLLKYADNAMYRVKKSSKNHYCFWHQQ